MRMRTATGSQHHRIGLSSDPDSSSVASTAPVSIAFAEGMPTFSETANATVISQLTAIDPDSNDTPSYSMAWCGMPTMILSAFPGGMLRSGVVFDFETYSRINDLRACGRSAWCLF